VTTMACKVTIVAAVEKFWVQAQCWTKTKWKTLCFIWRGDGWYSCSVETSPRKFSFLLAVCCLECHKCHLVRATEFQKLSPYKLVPENDFPLGWDIRSWYCRWFRNLVGSALHDPELMYLLGELWCTLTGSVHSQNNKVWCGGNSCTVRQPLYVTANSEFCVLWVSGKSWGLCFSEKPEVSAATFV
jgi:hypothetical protein